MTDRELIELAAKAVGVFLDWEFGPRLANLRPLDKMNPAVGWWNPLADDGQALRLAVDLHITIDRSEVKNAAYVYSDYQDIDVVVIEDHGTDRYAATRRAIVRAAAEIGKAM